MSLPDYYSRFNPDLLALIPPDCKVVLEIGCGAGALCEAYRRVNPGVEWHGWDIDEAAVNAAIGRGVKACRVDIEFDPAPIHPKEQFDCLILGDILEHLKEPWAELHYLKCFLAPGAQVLASIPNVQHWTVIRDLLAGKWEYADEGLLDRTHLRFFTLDSIRKMFDQAGLHIHEIRGRNICNDGLDAWIGLSGIACTKKMRAYQYIVRAVKPIALHGEDINSGTAIHRTIWNGTAGIAFEPPTKLHIHAVTAEECCARPRIHEPFAALSIVPGIMCTTNSKSEDVMLFRAPNIVIQQRWRSLVSVGHQQRLIEGSLVIAELDDEPEAIGMDPMALRAVHAVQVSTEPLAEIVRRYNPNVMVFPNQIASLDPLRPRRDNGEIRIFYGAQNREADWLPIMPALLRVIHAMKVTYGITVSVVHDKAFFDALGDGIEKMFTPFANYDSYRMILGACDIALLPLEPGQFNECKSDIKFLECAAEGVVVLANETVYFEPIYELGPEDCVKGMTYYSAGQFARNLRALIDSPKIRCELATNAYAYVRDNRMLGQHFRKRLAWYRDLLNSREDLTRQLVERVPELRPQHALATTGP